MKKEFLGDALLDMLIADRLLKSYPSYPEGKLTKMRAGMVCEQALSSFANRVGLTKLILHDKSVESSALEASIAADVVEAVVAAIYLDGGFDAAQTWVEKNITEQDAFTDYKTSFQEFLAKNAYPPPVYADEGTQGPPHSRVFLCSVSVDQKKVGIGKGHTKKDAEQKAAKMGIEYFKQHDIKA